MFWKNQLILMIAIFFSVSGLAQENVSQFISPETQGCLACHRSVTPGIVGDWETSRHSRIIPSQALQKPHFERRISTDSIPDSLMNHVVGCAECHRLNPKSHEDTFTHSNRQVHIVVTPEDCAVCHPSENGQYAQNKMAHARSNLLDNPLYREFIIAANGTQRFHDGKLSIQEPDSITNTQSCLFCHGTEVKVRGTSARKTIFGEMNFPVLSGWPNQGTGRLNPDQSIGSCTPCHARHNFSIEMARKPYTCGECHKGPDVLAYKVYEASKMGNIYSSMKSEFNFDAVPWKVGKDFTAPTCATCHVSLLTDSNGNVVARRSHQMNDRLYVRLFGLPYAHPQPRSPRTSGIRNAAGLSLPTNLDGTPVSAALIGQKEQEARRQNMMSICKGCHSTQWTEHHFNALDEVIDNTNERTLEATGILQATWQRGIETGPARGGSIFDEPIEKEWIWGWFFNANSIRLAAAMAGADYGVFDNGRWQMSKNIREMHNMYRQEVMLQRLDN